MHQVGRIRKRDLPEFSAGNKQDVVLLDEIYDPIREGGSSMDIISSRTSSIAFGARPFPASGSSQLGSARQHNLCSPTGVPGMREKLGIYRQVVELNPPQSRLTPVPPTDVGNGDPRTPSASLHTPPSDGDEHTFVFKPRDYTSFDELFDGSSATHSRAPSSPVDSKSRDGAGNGIGSDLHTHLRSITWHPPYRPRDTKRDKHRLKPGEEERVRNASRGLDFALEMSNDENTKFKADLQANGDDMATTHIFPHRLVSTSSGGEGSPEPPSYSTLPPPYSGEDVRLRPPKLAPSTWQLYFTDWIQSLRINNGDQKLNVAQAAKEAGRKYAQLTPEEKEAC